MRLGTVHNSLGLRQPQRYHIHRKNFFRISFMPPVFPNVRLAVDSEAEKCLRWQKISVMQSLASSPVHRFPLKFTSNEINAPFSLNFFIISMAFSLTGPPSPKVIPLVWKHLVFSYISSGKSSKDNLFTEDTCGRKPPAVYEDLRHIRNSKIPSLESALLSPAR